ncbi:hypothetical protein ABB02_01530 [Clostridiaceae bacterium JG1575]|nr:hypothetical protein ABB02_01530 [Clostridiaceae bacterium JG1575]
MILKQWPKGGAFLKVPTGSDGCFTLMEEALWLAAKRRGEGLCLRRFVPDVLAFGTPELQTGDRLRLQDWIFTVAAKGKRCHPGCPLFPKDCPLHSSVYFIHAPEPLWLHVGDRLEPLPKD